MLTWGQFKQTQPELAEAGRALICQFGVALGFLGTTRKDGAPRVHPIAPQFVDERLYAFITPSPKRDDLLRDGRYALHSYPRPEDEDAFYITGRAQLVIDEDARRNLWAAYVSDADRIMSGDFKSLEYQTIFEFLLDTALLTRTTGHGDPTPKHTVWHTDKK
jgi:hypothetical protein